MTDSDDLVDRFVVGDPEDPDSAVAVAWSRLATVGIGSAILAYFTGVVALIVDGFSWATEGILSLRDGIVGVGTSLGDVIGHGLRISAGSFEEFTGVLGPAAFPISVATVVVVLWIVSGVARYVQ